MNIESDSPVLSQAQIKELEAMSLFGSHYSWIQRMQTHLASSQCNLPALLSNLKVISSVEKGSVSDTVILSGLIDLDNKPDSKSNVIMKLGFVPRDLTQNALEVERAIYKNVLYSLLINNNTPCVMAYLGSYECPTTELMSSIKIPTNTCDTDDISMEDVRLFVADYIKTTHLKPSLTFLLSEMPKLYGCEIPDTDDWKNDIQATTTEVWNNWVGSPDRNFYHQKLKDEQKSSLTSNKIFRGNLRLLRENQAIELNKSFVLASELSNGITLSKWFELPSLTLNDVLSVMFQVYYTLSCFNNILLHHNDLHYGNIFVEELPDETTLYFQRIANTYVTLKTDYLIKIYDFDRGSSPKVPRNLTIDYDFCEDYGQCNLFGKKGDSYSFTYNLYDAMPPALLPIIKPFMNEILSRSVRNILLSIKYINDAIYQYHKNGDQNVVRVLQDVMKQLDKLNDENMPQILAKLNRLSAHIPSHLQNEHLTITKYISTVSKLKPYVNFQYPHLLKRDLPDDDFKSLPKIMNKFLTHPWPEKPFNIVDIVHPPKHLTFKPPKPLVRSETEIIGQTPGFSYLLIADFPAWVASVNKNRLHHELEVLEVIVTNWKNEYGGMTNLVSDQKGTALLDYLHDKYTEHGRSHDWFQDELGRILMMSSVLLLLSPIYNGLDPVLREAILKKTSPDSILYTFVCDIWALCDGVLPVPVTRVIYT